jgi:hypothetical protein
MFNLLFVDDRTGENWSSYLKNCHSVAFVYFEKTSLQFQWVVLCSLLCYVSGAGALYCVAGKR